MKTIIKNKLMKANRWFVSVMLLVLVANSYMLTSCSDMLDEENFGNPTVEAMMANEDNVILLVGQAYAEVKWIHDHWGYWGVSSLTADECVCPVRMPSEHWADGGYWKRLNDHSWNSFADAFKNIWNSTIAGAVLCNKLIQTLKDYESSMDPQVFTQYVGELEVMRSYYYYLLFDCFGRIPYLEVYEDVTEPLMEPQVVWAHLVAVLERNAPNLPIVNDANRAANYGRVTQGMAYALLARLYLNAESYGCTPDNIKQPLLDSKSTVTISSTTDFYTNCARCCENVIQSGAYSISKNFFDNFLINNENSKENIFVIVENGKTSFDSRSSGSMSNKLRIIHLTLHYCHQTTYNMIEKPWNGFCARPSFMALYNAKDVRGDGSGYDSETLGTTNPKRFGWFVGPVKDAKGKQLQDENHEDAIITKNVVSLDEATWNDGARLWKYEVDKDKTYEWAENDFVLFRYADVLWMNEEAILRGGTGTSHYSDPDFVTLRKRAFDYETDSEGAYTAAYPNVLTLDGILDERGREFAWECIRRRDLIRFGKFETVEYVSATQPYRRWFPIPFSVIEKAKRDENDNPIWTQNEGY